jgi:hypothetical protein
VIRRIATPLVTIAALTALACVDMSAPDGAASISALLLPSPSVVVGDTMRDSTGAAGSLRVIAYDANSTPISGLATSFFVTDTAKLAHIANSSFLIGDKQGTVHVIGQVTGVQTVAVPISVTVAPAKFALSTTPALPDTFVVPFAGSTDTTSTSTGTQAIAVTLKGVGDTATVGFIVKYELVSAPATKTGSSSPAVFIVGDAAKPSLADTTDAIGASRSVIVKSALLADPALQSGSRSDSVVVLVSTFYKGKPVSGSPIHVKLPLKVKQVVP